MKLKVKRISKDNWSQPRLKAVQSGEVFIDNSCGTSTKNINGIPGDWYDCEIDQYGETGEPEFPIQKNIRFVLMRRGEER